MKSAASLTQQRRIVARLDALPAEVDDDSCKTNSNFTWQSFLCLNPRAALYATRRSILSAISYPANSLFSTFFTRRPFPFLLLCVLFAALYAGGTKGKKV